MLFNVALTGGIASGKSVVEQRFRSLGVPVCDADYAARVVVDPGSDGLAAIVAAFGRDVLDSQGRLDRPAMRQRIFADPKARKTLEAIVHPRVRQWMLDQAQHAEGPYVMLSIPLLTENIGHYRWVDRVVVVDVPETVQVQRLMARDGIDEDLATRILANQATRSARLALADDVIDNAGSEAALDAQVAALHERYLMLAANRR
ncbi:dephospho-CoA kinase [Dyella caseinilytica]|uniref:Dephospho-CoA kinase n=1 Tax=Dyella caseinilytica TaxID=1849581 RepID=A0ABX7H0M8_9GAMM|nr:dephospho-CoA kinase [Dyella caseinilytica]QRN55743.1 dephospho-CoA kinase [Dyella caseinilytica]GFZ93851.1 dephospho-CoA kinase [Dyella caseinilytica]